MSPEGNGSAYMNFTDTADFIPLHLACVSGSLEIVGLFLANHADVNAIGRQSNTPLEIAISNEHQDISKILLDSGAQINVNFVLVIFG